MAKDITFQHDLQQVLHNFFKLNNFINTKYLIIWVVLVLVSTISVILFRVSEMFKRKPQEISQKIKFSSEDIKIINEGMTKGKVMLDHIKNLRVLHLATERCYLKKNAKLCIEILTYCPHLVNVKMGPEGLTPFHRICNNGHSALMSFMLSKGADPWLTTASGENGLCLAINWCIMHPTGGLACVDILQRHGCFLDNTNKWFKIYFRAASLSAHKTLVSWMLNQTMPLSSRSSSFPIY